MKFHPRRLAPRLHDLLRYFSVVVVTGARQVGKSTLLERALPDWDRVVFDPVQDVAGARRDPDLFLDNHPAPLILDEIQFAPELVAALKRRVDRSRRPGQYVLTGSQQWSVLRAVAESLAGRAVFLEMEGLGLAELAHSRNTRTWLERYLKDPGEFVHSRARRLPLKRTLFEQLFRGFLPEANRLPVTALGDFLRAYQTTYVERDVRVIAEVSDWQQFGRFTQLASALTAQEINHSQLGREIGMTPQTAGRWLSTLRATFQWYEVPAWSRNSLKRVSGRAKGYFADPGFACALQRISGPRAIAGHPMAGALFETAVVSEIRKMCAWMKTPPALWHWRTHAGAEVDLILERDGTLFPIEIKLASRPDRSATRGFEILRSTFPRQRIAPGLVVAPCERLERLSERDSVVPWDLA